MKKLLILIVAYNAEKHIKKVLQRIPHGLKDSFEVEVLVLDDRSVDNTEAVAKEEAGKIPFKLVVIKNEVNLGYGANQKKGYNYAIKNGFDMVVLMHGDAQYPPEMIGDIVKQIVDGTADAVLGSRMLKKAGAIKGRMPLYKFFGNMFLTALQNLMLGTHLSEFHTGFRAYSVPALKAIPFERNSSKFHFDTEIIIQLLDNNFKIGEIAIPTNYGDEICHVNSVLYGMNVLRSTVRSRFCKWGWMHDTKFNYRKAS